MSNEKTQIKVLHLNATSSGGASIAAQRLSDALNKTGQITSRHFVFEGVQHQNNYVWANSFIKRKWAFFLHALEKLHFLFFERDKSIRFAFSHGLTGIRISKHPLFKDSDIIHLHWINKGFISLKELKRITDSGKPVVWTCHDMWAFTGGCYHNRGCDHYKQNCGNCQYLKNPAPRDLSYKVKIKKLEIIKSKQLQLITPSAWLAAIGKESKSQCNPIKVIGNAIDTDLFNVADRNTIASEYGFSSAEKRILFISGNLKNRFKGFEEFKLLMNKYTQQFPDQLFRVMIVGDRWENAGEQGKADYTFMGYVRDPKKMAALYNLADVYVTTSLEENLPTTVIESLSCGTPVLAFDVGGTKEIIEEEDYGQVIPCFDLDKMTIALHQMLGHKYDDELRKKRHLRMEEKFGAYNVAMQHVNLYHQCLATEYGK